MVSVLLYLSCSCGASPLGTSACRMTSIQTDGRVKIEERAHPTGHGLCDDTACHAVFFKDYGPRCKEYLTGRPHVGNQDFYACTCGKSPERADGCRLTALKRDGGVAHQETRPRGDNPSCNSLGCKKLFHREFGKRCEVFLPGPAT